MPPEASSTKNIASASKATSIDPDALMRIKSLELRAKIVVEGFLTGLHRSPYHGFSVEFSEYRQYSPGDDPRYLDWRLYARSDRYYIKRFEEETNLRCWLLVDLSRSMGFSTLAYNKAAYAKTAAATIAYFLSLQRDAVGLLTFDQTISEFLPPRFRPGHLHRLMLCLERSLGGESTDLEAPLERLAAVVSQRGLVVLLSDLLAPVDTLRQKLSYLRSRGHEVVLLRVLDPSEIDFRFTESTMFEDLETGRQLYIDPEAARENYLREFNAHRAEVELTCQQLGVDFYQVPTDQPLDRLLLDFLNSRMRGGPLRGQRRSNPAGGTR